jgi:TRAP transporter 4TM/12TM fusion protein
MKEKGFSPEQAGGIEVVASSGSQITPPIMSVAAFLMGMILGVPYVDIATAAIIPAILYFIGITIGITLLIRASPKVAYGRELVNIRLILSVAPSFLISFAVLLTLLYERYSPGYAAFWACAALLLFAPLRPREARPTLISVLNGVKSGAIIAAQLAVVLLAIGIIIQMFLTTGLGVILGRLLHDLSGGQLWLAAIVASVIAIGIGTALPTPAAYALMTVVIVPTLIDVGAFPLAAHFFALYWAAFSTITPPVAVGVLAAVRISGGSFLGTANEAFRLSIPVFMLPFAFLLSPEILGLPALGFNSLFVALLILLSAFALAAALYGRLRFPLSQSDRYLLFVGSLSLFVYLAVQSYWLLLPILISLSIVQLRQIRQTRRVLAS